VVFADISGFTALAERLDPETIRQCMNRCFAHLVPIVERYGGTVDKFIGDEIMALFGAPVAEPTNILFDWTFETDVNRIEQGATEIRMLYGSMGIERTIHLDMQSHPTDIAPSRAGHSIGRWENDVLIVDSVGFAPGILSSDGRVPHGEGLHVVERFTLDPETLTLSRTYTAEDAEYFVGEFRGADTVLPADLPYSGTTECEDRTYRAAVAASEADEPWYMFWKFWD
jgi:hypothetical protein